MKLESIFRSGHLGMSHPVAQVVELGYWHPERSPAVPESKIQQFIESERGRLVPCSNEELNGTLSSYLGRGENRGRLIWYNVLGEKLELGLNNVITDDLQLKMVDEDGLLGVPASRRFLLEDENAIAAAKAGRPLAIDMRYFHRMKGGAFARAPESCDDTPQILYHKLAKIVVVSREQFDELLRKSKPDAAIIEKGTIFVLQRPS